MNNKILHVCKLDKFIPPYINLIESNFNINNHFFILRGDLNKFNIKLGNNILYIKNIFNNFNIIKFIIKLNKSDKIILHSIPDIYISFLLMIQPWLFKKTYWVIWGGDLYYYKYRKINFKSNIYEFIRKFIIKRIGNIVTYIKGDYELAKKWYGNNGKYHECIMYESNIYKNIEPEKKYNKEFKILIGNSASETNNHVDIFNKIQTIKSKFIVPLTYGDNNYKNYILKEGNKILGKNFIPLVDFIDNNEYIKMLNGIDIAIFNHNRQQAMGNIISLLGMGKKVYIRNGTTQWQLFNELGIKLFDAKGDFSNLLDDNFSNKDFLNNIEIIKNYFSKEKLIEQWKFIFNN